MAAASSRGLALVLVEYEYQYEGRDGLLVSIKPNERYVLLAKTNDHWWQVRSDGGSKPFYIPARYVKELPAELPSPLDFSDQPAPEPMPLPLQTPVPVPVPKLDESRSRVGDEVTIRLRPDAPARYRRNENRMSTFGVLLDPIHDPPRPPNESPADGVEDEHRDSAKSRVPSFSPADPLPAPRTHQPIPVEMPVVPPLSNTLVPSSSTTGSHDNQQPVTEEEEAAISTEGSAEEEEKEEESHHIYESIQDLNLNLQTPPKEQTPPTGQEFCSPSPSSAIYANVSSLKKTPVSTDPAHTSVDHAPCSPGPGSSPLGPASPGSPRDGWQVHTDQQSGKRFYFHPLTRQSTWTSPPPPPTQGAEANSPPISPASPQGSSSVWEQLVDEASGRFYYYNPSTGVTSWNPPSQESPPPLPDSDYPVNNLENNDVFITKADRTVEAPPPHKDPNRSTGRSTEMMPPRMMGNGVSEEKSVRNWRHSMAEDMLSNHQRNISDFTDATNQRNSPESPQMLEKAGILNKTKVVENGKRIRKNWSQSWTVLHGGILTFHRDPRLAPAGNASKASQIVPEFTVELRGSSVCWAAKDKSSKKNVLELKTRQGCEFLMQYDTESIIHDWRKVIQDTIRQLEADHLSEDDEDSDKEDSERRRTSTRSSSGNDSEQRRVRNKLRRFLQRRPTLQSVKEKGYIRDNVFGCHLDTLCHRENSTIPKFVEKCIRTVERRGLDVDGIYRVSGNLAVIQKLRHKADHEEQLDLEDGQWEEIHVVTGALKLFLRELPEPLFPFSSFTKFITAIQDPDYSQRVSYLKVLVQTLPLPNHDTMQLLFRHLRRVVEHRDSNRMSVQSVAIVFGPTLLRPQTESASMTMNMVFQSQIVELLLNEFLTIFPQS